MTTSPPSVSEEPSSSFELLSEPVRRWVWQQGWNELRDIQERAIPAILDASSDVIIAAATAGGKTEAAFLPVVSRIANLSNGSHGFDAVYISPLKALINDQFRRLDELCEALEIPVHRWHGDVSSSAKAKARRDPNGILLITPESLEATFVLRGLEVPSLFAATNVVVIDELHAFIGSERGMQLQSLLHRLEVAVGRRINRIGLSATLGDMRLAADFLRRGAGDDVIVIESSSSVQTLHLQLRGYLKAPTQHDLSLGGNVSGENGKSTVDDDQALAVERGIAKHMFERLRGSHHLIFAGSRQKVEVYSDLLRRLSEDLRVPNEFYAHHANLSKEHREFVEKRMRERNLPTSAVCTSTLELGIDIGEIESVAQIGAPWSVAGLRQRLGRSGRRDDNPAVMRVYVEERAWRNDLHPVDALRCELVQAVAMVRLLVQRWCEPPSPATLHLSTLVQQILAVIAQYGGLAPKQMFDLLCGAGPFTAVDQELFVDILRCLGSKELGLVEQAPDGTLLLGEGGEFIVGNHKFYAVFLTPEEYRVVAHGKTLGTLPIRFIMAPGMTIIFSGRRWRILEVHDREKTIEVEAAHAGRPPPFGGEGGDLHDEVLIEMRRVYREADFPAFLDANARRMLEEGRATYQRLNFDKSAVVESDGDVFVFPWVGTVKLGTLVLALRSAGVDASARGIAIETSDTSVDAVNNAIRSIASGPPPDPLELASRVSNRIRAKYDPYLSDNLLCRGFASDHLNVDDLQSLARSLGDHKI